MPNLHTPTKYSDDYYLYRGYPVEKCYVGWMVYDLSTFPFTLESAFDLIDLHLNK